MDHLEKEGVELYDVGPCEELASRDGVLLSHASCADKVPAPNNQHAPAPITQQLCLQECHWTAGTPQAEGSFEVF